MMRIVLVPSGRKTARADFRRRTNGLRRLPLRYSWPVVSGTQSADINANAVPRMARHLREFASIRITRKTCK